MKWTKREFIVEVMVGLFFLTAGIVATYYANIFTTAHASSVVTDVILDNLPVINVNFIFTDGASIFFVILFLLALREPRRLPFMLKSIALFILIRSVFMMLTHYAPPEVHSYLDISGFLYRLSSGDDLFFSAHAGLPFMLAFVFWDETILRYFFLVCSAIGAGAVLLGHLHYSIDVFSAFFIAFGIFHITKHIFKRDYEMLREGVFVSSVAA